MTGSKTPSGIPDAPVGESSAAETADGECWRPPCDELLLYHFEPSWEELPPDEPAVGEYVLLDGVNEECLPAGEYELTDVGLVATGELTGGGEPAFRSERYEIERELTVSLDHTAGVAVSAEATVSSRSG